MAIRIVEKNELLKFQKEVKEAENDLKNREVLLNKIYDKFENNLVLLGATAVEDKLQDEVP